MNKLITTFLLVFSAGVSASNRNPTTTLNGVTDDRSPSILFTNAKIFVDSTTILNEAQMLVQNGRIKQVGKDIKHPSQSLVRDLNGASVYPGLILMDSSYGLSKLPEKKPFSFFGPEVINSTTEGAYSSNEAIKASYSAVHDFHHDSKTAKELRDLGFTSVLSSKKDGIMRGTSVLVDLNDTDDSLSVINGQGAFHLSFNKGTSKQNFPVSLMGASYLLRQTWMDAKWYAENDLNFTDLDLKAVTETQKLPQIFETNNWQQSLLANKIAKEQNKSIILRSSGDEYKHIDFIKEVSSPLIVPLNIPEAMDVSDELDAWGVSYEKMKEWEAAPYNPVYLSQNDITFSIAPTEKGLKTFYKDLAKTIKNGLNPQQALKSLTETPAMLLKQKDIGHLKSGARADFLIVEGDLFVEKPHIYENWIQGKPFVLNKQSLVKPGKYKLEFSDKTYDLEFKVKSGKITAKDLAEESEVKVTVSTDDEFVSIKLKDAEDARLEGLISGSTLHSLPGKSISWTAKWVEPITEKEDEEDNEENALPTIPQPFSAYGLMDAASDQSFLIKNATVWTNEEDGVLENTDVLLEKGKIKAIGADIKNSADIEIDGTGMHLTAGIIDEHSHIALLSVNDIAVNSSMVRMEDAVDPDDVDIYRNLAGGVTAAQLLHGSANPIGGQSALIKMRWGSSPENMLIENADGFVKFALGENVKRSRSQQSIRYPLTRMGVEQVYRDAFSQAIEYQQAWDKYNSLSRSAKKKTPAPRKDLIMEATSEILNKERFVSCHSYVQSEINMLMKVAEDYDFNINTFTHILEGYKVADLMKEHGVGASTFSDWWSYKWEVNYAIPYNAAIMTKVGVTTAINSDDAEMSRRLNQEAAKSIKYGGVSEEEALKMVTLNPAKLLHLDDRMGSVKVGKDADIVLWSENPLSIYAKAEKTFVDGKLLYDRSKQKELNEKIESERQRLITMMNDSDGKKGPPQSLPKKTMHCDSLTGYEHVFGDVK